MSNQEDREQIGPLEFVANADYPYPFKVEKPPRFWMEEQTGALSAAIDSYMDGSKLSAQELELIKIYLRQYIERAVLSDRGQRAQLVRRIDGLRSNQDIEDFADTAAEYGAEVF